MSETDNAALANPEDNGAAANTYSGYGIRDERRLCTELDGFCTVVETEPSYPSR